MRPQVTPAERNAEVIAAMNARDEQPTFAAYFNRKQAIKMIDLAGGWLRDEGRYEFPDGFQSWSVEESANYAIYSIAL